MEIVLIRHGKPTAAINPVVDAKGYHDWVANYNVSQVSDKSKPLSINDNYRDFYIISSDYKRAIESSYIYTGCQPAFIDSIYREMDIPFYTFPYVKFRAWTWLYLSRLFWILGYKGNFESFKEAKQRANMAALQLIEIAKGQPRIVLFGHGFMNRYIRKFLISQGWMLTQKSNQYWGETRLVKAS